MIVADEPRCEGRVDPVGLGESCPRFSWTVLDGRQAAFRIQVSRQGSELPAADLWDSGWVESGRCTGVDYEGTPLRSRDRAHWRVLLRDPSGAETASDGARFEMGLLDDADWSARWIGFPHPDPPTDRHWPCPFLRAEVVIPDTVRSARLFATAVGLYRLFVNGVEVSDDALRPGWTDYHRRIQHQTYDVTNLVRQGANAVGAILGPGWACGHVGTEGRRQVWADHPQLLAQLEVELDDGEVVALGTGPGWGARFGPLLGSDMHVGETYDARRELDGWAEPGTGSEGWSQALAAPTPAGRVVPQVGPSVRPVRVMRPVSVWNIGFNRAVVDLGQNIAGRVRLTVEAPEGTEIVLHHGEMLNPDGSVYRSNLRRAFAEDRYICRGGGTEIYEPSFTIHGFRYVEVWGLPDFIRDENIAGVVLHTEIDETSWFESGSPMLDRLDQAIRWTFRGNFVDVPTDCPQRDERLGWMADANTIVGTATRCFDVLPFLSKWLVDLEDAADDFGHFTDTAPAVGVARVGSPGWGDAGVLVPWALLRATGDERPARRLYRHMAAWLDRIEAHNPDHLRVNDVGFDWGDWLSWPDDAGSGRSPLLSSVFSTSPKEVLATGYWARMALALTEMATRLSRDDEARRFAEVSERVLDAYRSTFVAGDGTLRGDTQTVYAQALAFDLLPSADRGRAADHLARTVAEAGGRLTVGYVGLGLILPALAEHGHVDLAYRLLLSEEIPSWGALIKMGATTMWERWDGWTPERGFNDVRMNSFNHMGLGGVGEFLFRHIAGIDVNLVEPERPRLTLTPRPGPGLDWAHVRWRSPLGVVESGWRRRRNGALDFQVEVPAGVASAALCLPGEEALILGPGRHTRAGRA